MTLRVPFVHRLWVKHDTQMDPFRVVDSRNVSRDDDFPRQRGGCSDEIKTKQVEVEFESKEEPKSPKFRGLSRGGNRQPSFA